MNTGVAEQLPDLAGVAFAAARIDDWSTALWPEEHAAVASAQPRRIWEFSTGRHLARCAMADLGHEACAVPRAADRQPIWPAQLRGSITHAGDLAVAAVARSSALRGLGIDLEATDRVTERVFRKLFTPAERRRLTADATCMAGLMFSAKEAAYKAVNPLVGRFIGFQEAEVDVDPANRSFRLRYVGGHAPNRVMDSGTGHFCVFGRHVLTVFVLSR